MTDSSELGKDMAAPRGRPPARYRYVGGIFVHIETGTPFDSGLHAALVHTKKLACLKAHYWQRGGRSKRLERYERKRGSKRKQLTLTAQCSKDAVTTQTEVSAPCDAFGGPEAIPRRLD